MPFCCEAVGGSCRCCIGPLCIAAVGSGGCGIAACTCGSCGRGALNDGAAGGIAGYTGLTEGEDEENPLGGIGGTCEPLVRGGAPGCA